MDVVLTASAAAELDDLNEPIHSRVLRILERLESWLARIERSKRGSAPA